MTAPTVEHLKCYGFSAKSGDRWEGSSHSYDTPSLTIGVSGHQEVGSHTMYSVMCSLMGEASPVCLAWEAKRRLAHLRPLHDDLKMHLGESRYIARFKECPFARRMAPPGTTRRLHVWMQQLARCINECIVPPWLAMRTLVFLEAPIPPRLPNGIPTNNGSDASDKVAPATVPPSTDRSRQASTYSKGSAANAGDDFWTKSGGIDDDNDFEIGDDDSDGSFPHDEPPVQREESLLD
mmetsp:Transcript_20099/g.46844  ORF Transcript_20099/g.46844 Transcript_20099/m.46844 type:complete len:236 (+) Transcript_20099:65-772(+)